MSEEHPPATHSFYTKVCKYIFTMISIYELIRIILILVSYHRVASVTTYWKHSSYSSPEHQTLTHVLSPFFLMLSLPFSFGKTLLYHKYQV